VMVGALISVSSLRKTQIMRIHDMYESSILMRPALKRTRADQRSIFKGAQSARAYTFLPHARSLPYASTADELQENGIYQRLCTKINMGYAKYFSE